MQPEPDRGGADAALAVLIDELGSVLDELTLARERARTLSEQRAEGRDWYDIVSSEERPLIVEQISSAMASLATAGSEWRREQAAALAAEDVSINRIASLYGVTRQRVSALLRDRVAAADRHSAEMDDADQDSADPAESPAPIAATTTSRPDPPWRAGAAHRRLSGPSCGRLRRPRGRRRGQLQPLVEPQPSQT